VSAFTRAALRADGFTGFITFQELRAPITDVTTGGVVYAVLRPSRKPPVFLATNPGGRFKGRDPSVSGEVLRAKC
jgi:hypothetical protein